MEKAPSCDVMPGAMLGAAGAGAGAVGLPLQERSHRRSPRQSEGGATRRG